MSSQQPQVGLSNPQAWTSALYAEHPLVGVVWDIRRKTAISPAELNLELQSASYLLLGEKHDNPDHHSLQLAVLASLLEANKLHSVSFEMMSDEIQASLNRINQTRFSTEDELKDFIQWDDQGWNWGFYGPLLRLVIDNGVAIRAGNISRQRMSAVYADLDISKQWEFIGAEVLARLIQDIDDSHCGLLPESQFSAMVRVQQARDSAMAKSLPPPISESVSVLIAGNYHARQDLGVPNYLLREHNGLARTNIASLSFVEVSPQGLDPEQYLESTAGVPAHDYIWFTPAVSNEDYCASMREGV
ncbi:MAG: putative iron-regulated protein [Pseudohongiellaceae bacterium]